MSFSALMVDAGGAQTENDNTATPGIKLKLSFTPLLCVLCICDPLWMQGRLQGRLMVVLKTLIVQLNFLPNSRFQGMCSLC